MFLDFCVEVLRICVKFSSSQTSAHLREAESIGWLRLAAEEQDAKVRVRRDQVRIGLDLAKTHTSLRRCFFADAGQDEPSQMLVRAI